jgi:uncharacterized protein YyaL (SSP411 family)
MAQSKATEIPWLPWGTEAFQRAHASGRPVLLSIVASWSAACRAMDARVFADPAIAAAVRAHAVPVRVDADHRPDIAERYGLGGWPTTAWLTPDGDILSGGTYLEASALASALLDVATRFQRDRESLTRQAAAAREQRRQERQAPHAAGPPFTLIRDRVLREFDPEYGGFGRGAKFPLAMPVLFALHAGVSTSDRALIAVAETTLDRMAESALSDPRDGAFHRACANRDWTEPDRARLLDVQAEMIALYLEAWRLLHHERYRVRALAALRYVDATLRDPEKDGFFNSHAANGERASEADEPGDAPVDPLIVTDANARMIRTLVHASHVLEEAQWLTHAVNAAERLLPAVYAPKSGVAHCLGPRERPFVFGLLADAVFISAALLDLGDAAGQNVYVELAEELMRSCLRKFWDADSGGFVDRIRTSAGAGDVGLLGEPLKPFSANVQAARLLSRLAERTQDAQLASRARELFAYLASVYDAQGILSSEYGLVLLELGMIEIAVKDIEDIEETE